MLINMKLTFLGTGGGRYVTSAQKRATGGIHLELDGKSILIDPGPCSLCKAHQYRINPRYDILCISHKHTDHTAGASAVIEAMTGSTREKRGTLICPAEVVKGSKKEPPVINPYYPSLLSQVTTLKPGQKTTCQGIEIKATATQHGDLEGIGFVFNKKLAYTGDTGYTPEIAEAMKGMDCIIINLISPNKQEIPVLMTTPGAVKLLKTAKPKRAIITHFGMNMLKKGPENVARILQETTGVPTTAAKDGMQIDLTKKKVNEWR